MRKTRTAFQYRFHKYLAIPFKILRKSLIDSIRHDGIEHAGYLAFLGILSFFPALIFMISVIGLFGESELGRSFVLKLFENMPKDLAAGLSPRINEIISGPENSFLTIAIIGVIWTASSSVEGLRTILNRAYRVIYPPPYLWRRMVSIFDFFLIIFTLISGLTVLIIAPKLLRKFEIIFGLNLTFDFDFFYLRQIATFFLLVATTSLLYFCIPNVKQKFRQTIPGAVLAVIFWILLGNLLSIYAHNFKQVNFVYGSIASIIISLIFFYLMSLAFILGAEFNYHFYRTFSIFLGKKNSKNGSKKFSLPKS